MISAVSKRPTSANDAIWVGPISPPGLGFTGLTRTWQTLAPPRQERYIIEQVFIEMHSSEAQLRIMIDTMPALAWSCLPDGANEFTNNRWRDYTGLSQAKSLVLGWQRP